MTDLEVREKIADALWEKLMQPSEGICINTNGSTRGINIEDFLKFVELHRF